MVIPDKFPGGGYEAGSTRSQSHGAALSVEASCQFRAGLLSTEYWKDIIRSLSAGSV